MEILQTNGSPFKQFQPPASSPQAAYNAFYSSYPAYNPHYNPYAMPSMSGALPNYQNRATDPNTNNSPSKYFEPPRIPVRVKEEPPVYPGYPFCSSEQSNDLSHSISAGSSPAQEVPGQTGQPKPPQLPTAAQALIQAASGTSASTPSSARSATSEDDDGESDRSSTSRPGSTSFKMPPKKRAIPVPPEKKDNSYWEKRNKNNVSAKRSRDMRRQKEEQIAMKVVYLEQENLQLRTEVGLLRGEIDKLRCMMYQT